MHFFLFNIYPAAKTYPAAAKKEGNSLRLSRKTPHARRRTRRRACQYAQTDQNSGNRYTVTANPAITAPSNIIVTA